MSTIEERKTQALKFFRSLPHDDTRELCPKCEVGTPFPSWTYTKCGFRDVKYFHCELCGFEWS